MTQLFGTRVEPLWQFAIDSNVTEGLPFAWVLVAGAMGLAAVRIALWVGAAADSCRGRPGFRPTSQPSA